MWDQLLKTLLAAILGVCGKMIYDQIKARRNLSKANTAEEIVDQRSIRNELWGWVKDAEHAKQVWAEERFAYQKQVLALELQVRELEGRLRPFVARIDDDISD